MKVLGVVGWKTFDKGGTPIAGVRPLYELQKSEWREIDATDEYPTQGQVFWFAAHEAVENALVLFRPESNPGQKDAFRLLEPQIVFEIIDLRGLGGVEQVRNSLATGLRRSGIPPGRVYVWCAPDILVGPIKLIRTSDGLMRFDAGNRDKIPTFAVGTPRRIKDGAQERLLRMDDSAATGYVDWDEDAQIVKRALQAAVNLAKKSGQDLGQTRRQIEEAAEAIVAEGVGPDAALHRYRLERARSLLANAGVLSKLGPELVEILREHPTIAEESRRNNERIRSEVEADARADMERQLQAAREDLRALAQTRDQLATDVVAKEQALVRLGEDADGLRSGAERVAREIEDAVTLRVQLALDRPAELLAEASVLRPLINQAPRVPRSSSSVFSSWQESVHLNPTISDRSELQRALKAAAQEYGIAPVSMLNLHAAIVAGLVPVMMGPNALSPLVAYAHAACGGRLGLLHTSPGFIRPQDLVGTSEAGVFEPHQSGLLTASASTRDLTVPSLLVLEGANRSPLESSLVPILQLREAGLPFRAPHVAEAISIPVSLRLAVTFVAGVTTVPVTADLWNYAVALDSMPGPLVRTGTTPTQLTMSSDLLVPGDTPSDAVESLIELWPECSIVRRALERYGAALSGVHSDPMRIRLALLEGIVLPFLVSSVSEEEHDALVAKLVDGNESTLHDVATRLRRRLR